MGYEVDMEMSVRIPLSKEKDLKNVFKELAKKESKLGGGSSGKEKKFSFVDSGYEKCKTVEEMFECWRYSVSRDDNSFIIEYFDGQKLGDDQILWTHLETIVDQDSFIEISGEDGTHFKWSFKNGKFKESFRINFSKIKHLLIVFIKKIIYLS